MGNKRRIFQNFLDAREGDLIIGYESNPVKQVVAICRVTKQNDGENLYFEAGFGPENFASTVSIDISNVIQIIVEDTPIFINVCAGRVI